MGDGLSPNREQILNAIRSALEPLDSVTALWEGGAAAFNRIDQWSDIDLQVICNDDKVEEVFAATENGLTSLAPITHHYRLPEPTWHGHSQAFYLLEGSSPYLMIDFVVMKRSNPQRMREREIHGEALTHFDKEGILVDEQINQDAHSRTVQKRLEQIRGTFELFQPLVLKELNRGNAIEALQFYYGVTLRPLIELLRIRHAPARYNFHTRYLYYDLPADVVSRLEPLFFVRDSEGLRQCHSEAVEWVNEILDQG